ncbi:hypothetical protein [Zhongshania aliphaticivorans]|uniref:hypothetical protein n=1 Tax=Zhongshania aliphaticivorans TaxID=1470434 RepID=UPI0039C988DF
MSPKTGHWFHSQNIARRVRGDFMYSRFSAQFPALEFGFIAAIPHIPSFFITRVVRVAKLFRLPVLFYIPRLF